MAAQASWLQEKHYKSALEIHSDTAFMWGILMYRDVRVQIWFWFQFWFFLLFTKSHFQTCIQKHIFSGISNYFRLSDFFRLFLRCSHTLNVIVVTSCCVAKCRLNITEEYPYRLSHSNVIQLRFYRMRLILVVRGLCSVHIDSTYTCHLKGFHTFTDHPRS